MDTVCEADRASCSPEEYTESLAALAVESANEIQSVLDRESNTVVKVHQLSRRLKENFAAESPVSQSIQLGLVSFRSIVLARQALASTDLAPNQSQSTEKVIERFQEIAKQLESLTADSPRETLIKASTFCDALFDAIIHSSKSPEQATPLHPFRKFR